VLDQSPSADPGSEAFRLSLKSALETMKDVPAFTSKLTIEPDTHNPHNKPVVILQIKDGQWKIVKTYEP